MKPLGERWRDREAAHVVYGWQPQRKRARRLFIRAEGSALWDEAGRRHIDFASGQISVNIGYGHPHVLGAMERQMRDVTYVAPTFATEARIALAAKVAELTPASLNHVFFTNSGSESVENALKIARAATGRTKFLSAWQSYHGATAGASAVSGDPRRAYVEPVIPGISRFNLPGVYRSPFGVDEPVLEEAVAIAALESLVAHEGPTTIAGIILETIVGTNGLYVVPRSFIEAVRRLCDAHGILFIADETMCGWGRSGAWFALEHVGVQPDILVTAKGITSGYVPLGAVVLSDAVFDVFTDRPFVCGLTNEGHALACAAGLATLEVYEHEALIQRSRELGSQLLGRLRELAARHPSVGAVRAKGLFACLELTADPEKRRSLAAAVGAQSPIAEAVASSALDRGLILLARSDFIFVAPPLSIPDSDLATGLEILDAVLTQTDHMAHSARHAA